MVDITITEQGERQIVKISGELDNTASRDAVKALAPITEQENYDVEVDCSELKYISSSGLRLLLNIYKLKKVLDMGGFLTIFETEE